MPAAPTAAPAIDVFNSKAVFPPLLERFEAMNVVHSGLKRLSRLLFLFTIPGLGSELMHAFTVRLFADYNVALITGDDIPDRVPAYYTNFAQNMNLYDDSGFGWAYIDDTTNTIVWDEKLAPTTPASLGLLEHEILERYLPKDHVAVSQHYFENAERLRFLETQRELKYFKQRAAKRTQEEGEPEMRSAEVMTKFDLKRKQFEEAANAAKKQKAGEASGSGSGAGASMDME
ncbi:hypothetical protein C8F04DRAFT_1198051 [Mycena alexandri]|uniref:Uncharacterized protein n=1 Tax=Mycena alexandri TaxID=1745969 RepID=A0AAD6WPP2_9AGAR|nr:hypothetical protein C8F04DRAFT_1198051 [Mycena alexandri]